MVGRVAAVVNVMLVVLHAMVMTMAMDDDSNGGDHYVDVTRPRAIIMVMNIVLVVVVIRVMAMVVAMADVTVLAMIMNRAVKVATILVMQGVANVVAIVDMEANQSSRRRPWSATSPCDGQGITPSH